MRVTDTIRIPLAREGEPGEDTVSLEPSTAIVAFSEDTTSVQVTFRAYQGTTQIYVGNIWGSGDFPAGVDIYGERGSDDLSYVYTFTRTDPSIDIDAQVDFTANISGGTLTASVERTRTLHFISLPSLRDSDLSTEAVLFKENGSQFVYVSGYRGATQIQLTESMVSVSPSSGAVWDVQKAVSGQRIELEVAYYGATTKTSVNETVTVTTTIDGAVSEHSFQVLAIFDGDDGADGADGKDALRLDYNPNMVFGPADTALSQTLTIYRGDTALTVTAVQNSTSLTDKATLRGSVNSDGTVAVTVQRTSTSVDLGEGESHSFQVATSNGEAITVPFMVYSFKNGDDGKDGDPGEDAVYYELDATGSTAVYKAIAGAFAPTSIEFSGYKVTGTERAAAYGDYTVYYHGTDDGASASWHQVDAGSGNSFILDFATAVSDYNLRYGFPVEFRVLWVPDDDAATRIERVIPISNSYAIRGPQRWDDLADSYEFQSGQVGDIYLDVVIHEINGGDNYYYCVNTHVKSAGREPGTQEVITGNNGYWQQMNKLDSVATSLLLADYAKVANLFVDDLFMVGQQTCIWLNPDNDGMKINPVSALNGNTDRADQSAQDAAWSNPLVEFSAADLPDVADIYGGDVNGNATLAAGAGSYTGANLAEENYSGSGWGAVETDINAYSRLGTLTEGAMVRVAGSFPSSGALSLILTEGEISGDAARDPEFYKSHVAAELRLSNSNSGAGTYIRLAQANAICSSTDAGAECTVEFSAFDMAFTCPFSGAAYLQLWLSAGDVRCNSMGATASVRFSGGVIATISSVTEQYVARYVGQGAFIGLASDTYARFALISGQSRHTLLVEGNGLDISSDGFMQLTEQKASETHRVPPGGTLLTAWVSLSGGSIQANYWTWDGTSISMRWADTGSYAFSIPSAWETKLRGASTLNASHFAINVTAIQGRTAGYTANVWYAEQGEVQVVLRNADGDLQDGASYLTVHYIGDGQSIG